MHLLRNYPNRNFLLKREAITLVVLVILQLNAFCASSNTIPGEINESRKDTLTPLQSIMAENNWLYKPYFKGVVILDGKVMQNAVLTLDTITKSSIVSMSVIRTVSPDSIRKYGEAAKNGIVLLERNQEGKHPKALKIGREQ